MIADSAKPPLQHQSPKVLVLGDNILDLFVYDKRPEDADKSLGSTAPLSRDDWHYAPGFETRRCVAGASAIHAMLWANDIPVAGNSLRDDDERRALENSGSIFVLRRRANAGKDAKSRTRSYLVTRPELAADEKSDEEKHRAELTGKDFDGKNKKKYRKVSEDRGETWRAAVNLLSKNEVDYVSPFAADAYRHLHDEKQKTSALKAFCLWDVDRGFFRQNGEKDAKAWEDQQEQLFAFYKSFCSGTDKPPIVIRTSDPKHFKSFLERVASERDAPAVILVCALAQLKNGDLRGSGTWSGVWKQLYDYLKDKDNRYLVNSRTTGGGGKRDWRFHIVVPVYQDGVIWIGPDRWPLADHGDRAHAGEDDLPIGSLFMVPGAQPGLSEFEEHGRIIGVHTLLTHAIVEHLAAEKADPQQLSLPIRQGLLRIRRLRTCGYAGPDELVSLKPASPGAYIGYPCEVWRKGERDITDSLLELTGFAGDREVEDGQRQFAGPYEVACKVDPNPPQRIFHALEKTICGDFVASPQNCIRVASDVSAKSNPNLINKHWFRVDGKTYPIDWFSDLVIESSWLRQRIAMQFGQFAMADPKEAGSILDLAQRAKQHVLNNRYNSPEKGTVFNFALFGSPGSGKSFLAREIAASIDPREEIFSTREYNISQFTDPAQLVDAFKMIASDSVGAKVPLVLWDEFDSVLDGNRGGWLARFLMPMQDAHFFDGRERRPVGTAVFVFIGGTFATAEQFRQWACETKSTDGGPPESVLLKARDFHSRLYTALDMPRIIQEDPSERFQKFMGDWKISYAMFARAVLLRHYFRLGSKLGQATFLEEVDKDLCRFLLAIPLRHGARSLERIVQACLVSKPSKLGMMHLPPNHFLAEHIETENVRCDDAEEMGMTIDEMKRLATAGGT